MNKTQFVLLFLGRKGRKYPPPPKKKEKKKKKKRRSVLWQSFLS